MTLARARTEVVTGVISMILGSLLAAPGLMTVAFAQPVSTTTTAAPSTTTTSTVATTTTTLWQFFDSFDRPDNPVIGNDWIEKNPDAFSLSGNVVVTNPAALGVYAENIVYRPATEDLLDVEASAEFMLLGATPGYPQIHVRVQSDTVAQPGVVDSYLLFVNNSTAEAILGRQPNPFGPGNLATIAINPALNNADTFRLRLRTVGTAPVELWAFVERFDGASWQVIGEANVTDNSADRITSAGSCGFSAYIDNNLQFDNFSCNFATVPTTTTTTTSSTTSTTIDTAPDPCGDGVVELPEECDDGGESATCDADCTLVFCGDDTTNTTAGETCDGTDDVACSGLCQPDCTCPPAQFFDDFNRPDAADLDNGWEVQPGDITDLWTLNGGEALMTFADSGGFQSFRNSARLRPAAEAVTDARGTVDFITSNAINFPQIWLRFQDVTTNSLDGYLFYVSDDSELLGTGVARLRDTGPTSPFAWQGFDRTWLPTPNRAYRMNATVLNGPGNDVNCTLQILDLDAGGIEVFNRTWTDDGTEGCGATTPCSIRGPGRSGLSGNADVSTGCLGCTIRYDNFTIWDLATGVSTTTTTTASTTTTTVPGAVCGNNIVEPGETCDGDCPISCDDTDACTADTLTGSAATCDVVCTNDPITQCLDADGCCAPGCNALNDNDCTPTCGNGVAEPGETCDGDCPISCDDTDACTTDTLTGTAATCDVVCTNDPITQCLDADGCCAPGCNALNDNDCTPTCGNGVLEPTEDCEGTDDVACSGLCQPDCTCPTAQFFDDFDRPDDTDLGNGWEIQPGDPVDNWALSNGAALMTFTEASFENRNARVRPLAEAVENVRGTVDFNSSNLANFPQMWLRFQDVTTNSLDGYIFYVDSDPAFGTGVVRTRNGAFAWQRMDLLFTPAANTNYRMNATVDNGPGDAVDCTLQILDLDAGGVQVFSQTWTDDGTEGCGGEAPCSIQGPGRSGLSGYGGCVGCTISYDNFTIVNLDTALPTTTTTVPTTTTTSTLPGVCGDNVVNQVTEACDGTDDVACSGLCQPDCTCPTVQFFDDFNRPNADDLNNGWETQPGNPVDNWTLTGNTALMTFTTRSSENESGRVRPLAEALENVRATVDFNSSNLTNFPQIWLRMQDVTTNSLDGYLFYLSNTARFGTGVLRWRNGAWAWQRLDTTTFTPAANTNYRMNATVDNGPGDAVDCTLQILDLDAGGVEVFNRTWRDDGTEGCGGTPPCSLRGPGRSGLSGYGGCIGCTISYDNFTIVNLDTALPTTTTTVPTTTTTTTLPGACGDNVVNQVTEACDGTDDVACSGLCQPDCTCPTVQFFDDFNRPNADDLENGWEVQPGNPVDTWTLTGNAALMTFQARISETQTARVRPLGEAVMNVRGTVDFNSSNLANFPQMWLRFQDVTTNSLDGYLFYVSNTARFGTGVLRERNGIWAWQRLVTTWIPAANTNYRMNATVDNGPGDTVDCTLQILDLDAGGIEVFNQTWTDDGTEGCGGAPPCSIRGPGRSALSGYGGCIGCTISYDNFAILDLDAGLPTTTTTTPTTTTTTTLPGVCGDNIVNQPSEACDGADDVGCSGLCRVDCTCPTVQFFDDFNRVNANDLNNGWEVQPGNPVDHWTLTGNAARMSFSNGSYESRNARIRPLVEAVENVRGSVDFDTSNPINFPEIWLRFQDINTDSLDGYLFYASNDPGFGTGVIRERNGAFAWQRFTTAWTPAANTTYRMNATVENGLGSAVNCTLQILDLDAGGVEVFNQTWTDDGTEGCAGAPPCSIRGPGRSGLSGYGGCIGCTIDYDNFTILDLDARP